MRVKEVSVHGFKSFANRHRFVFPSGITAVVGPNGSGKSNVADAIRWVLGEQRSSSLRAKRVDDMIFAGTARRARSGFAQVAVTFENEDGWLDIDYPEVELVRRVHRDGSAQYTINGAQVRLRDVVDLLGGQLGEGNYTVIGQGLVDAALALRPDQRRGLVDEAAGLVPLQRKRERSLRQLEKTDQNLTRVRDILAELGPRLRRMTRLAERAAQHREVADELRDTLSDWYGYHWHRALDHRKSADADEARRRAEVEKTGLALAASDAAVAEAEARGDRAEARLTEAREQREARMRSDAAARQANAVALARLDGLRSRELELSDSLARDRETLASQSRRVVDGREALDALEAAENEARLAAEAARSAVQAAEREREARARGIEAQRAAILKLESDREARERRAAELDAQIAARETEDAEAGRERDRLDEAAEAAEAELEQSNIALEAAEDALDAAHAALAAKEVQQVEIGRELDAARELHAGARTRLETLRARADTIESLVGEIDQANRVIGRLRSQGMGVAIVGGVAELLEVPEAWSSAAAIALGSTVHGVLLGSAEAADIDQALRLATADVRGQVTLLALPAEATGSARKPVLGIRADEAIGAPRAEGLPNALLHDTVFVEDDAEARSVLEAEAWVARAATREGVLHRRGGMLVAGAAARDLLELQRERRSLPASVAEAAAEAERAERAVDALAAKRRETEAGLGELTEARNLAGKLRADRGRAVEASRARADQARRQRTGRRKPRPGARQIWKRLGRNEHRSMPSWQPRSPSSRRCEARSRMPPARSTRPPSPGSGRRWLPPRPRPASRRRPLREGGPCRMPPKRNSASSRPGSRRRARARLR